MAEKMVRLGGERGLSAILMLLALFMVPLVQGCASEPWELTVFYAGGEGYLRGRSGIQQTFPREVAELKTRLASAEERNAIAIHGGGFVPADLILAKMSMEVFRRAQEVVPWSACGSGMAEMLGGAYLQERWSETGCPALGGDRENERLKTSVIVRTRSGKTIGIVQWTPRLKPNDRRDDATTERAGKALSEVRAKTDAQILIVGLATRNEIVGFTQAYPGADLVIVRDALTSDRREAGVLQEIGRTPAYFSGGPTEGLVELKVKLRGKVGLGATVVGGPKSREPDSDLATALAEPIRRWADAYTAGEFDGFKVTELKYSGGLSCRACHKQIYDSWFQSRHAYAIHRLQKTRDEFDPDCLPCHTTGFQKGGFRNMRDTMAFASVQCEACHGSGLGHVRKPEVRLAPVTPRTCLSCHTPEWSPNFDPREVWESGTHIRPDRK